MRVAVVWNHDSAGVINRFGQPRPEYDDREIVDSLVGALQEGGHETLLCEGDKGLLSTLQQFMPPDPQGRPSGIVFNWALGGIQGECRYTHVPAMLEMAGVPYTGSGPLAFALGADKVVTKMLIRDRGVPTPNFQVMHRGTESAGDLRFPVVVKPRYEGGSLGLQLVHEPAQLKQAVEMIVTQYAQNALVEEYIEGREICVALLGNGEPEVLPLVEQDFGDRETRLMTWDMKYGPAAVPKICPAQIESGLATVLRDISIATFRACHSRDYARVDLRLDRSGQPFVLEINSPCLSTSSSYVSAATTAGYSFSSLVNRILNVAHTRYFGIGIS
ncbi:ATP-grasp domain-containing protein [Mesorhizobium sp. VK22B]|uniref:ATP-grasp domain-containing protein n=1 Tax=Mesorhizobium captivum TaxID=3072319 RepID=A0ABU4ZD74_9HYPH|nr:ATP-grasp domain-containing protein [Mesorhizobium sp. VK22B]MDX8496508.1 ATP-grasp domain-containing protein [Mesorhizobium sp. VK22B]